MEKIVVYVDWDSNYGAWLSILPGCVAVATSVPEVKKAIQESIELHLEGMKEDGEPIPEPFKKSYELHFELNAQALLKYYQNIITQAALSKVTGINQQQLSHYATGVRQPRKEQRERIVEGIRKLGKELLQVE